jgi:hypothetical protein
MELVDDNWMKKMDEKTWIGESLALACGGGRSHGISR